MVIQRIQTLYLLLSAVFMTVFLFVPYGYIAGDEGVMTALDGLSGPATVIPAAVAILLSLLAIFLFKAPSSQKLFVILSALVSLAVAALAVYVVVSGSDAASWGFGGAFPVLAIVCDVAALRGIRHDERLLRSYDRLR